MRTSISLLVLSVALLGQVTAQAGPDDPREKLKESWRLFWVERSIENNMAMGHVRGLLSRRPAPADWTPRESGKGRLAKGPGGIPILYLEGTPEEMGRQHGTLLKNEIRALQAYVEAFIGQRRMKKAIEQADRLFLKEIPPEYLREAKALAKAAGMPAKQILFAQWFSDLYRSFACSTLSAPSKDGVFLARNLDFPTMGYLQKYSVVVVARPEGKRPFVSITWPGLIGVLSGQNASLAASVLVVHDAYGARSGLPFQLAFRRVMEQCDTTAQAIALMRKTRITVTNNLMVVDKAGAARVLELHPEDGITTRSPQQGRLIATNHFVKRKQLRTSLTAFSSRRRFRAVRKTCPPGSGPVPLKLARKALAEASMPVTAQSMIFLPAKGEVEVAFRDKAPAAKGTFVRLPRELLLGR